jgi:hypothetical protein
VSGNDQDKSPQESELEHLPFPTTDKADGISCVEKIGLAGKEQLKCTFTLTDNTRFSLEKDLNAAKSSRWIMSNNFTGTDGVEVH